MSRTFGLAVGAVLVVVLPQQRGQDDLVLLVELQALLPLRAGRHGDLDRRRGAEGDARLADVSLLKVRNFEVKNHNRKSRSPPWK